MEAKTTIVTSLYNRKQTTMEVIDKLFIPSLLLNGNSDTEIIFIDDASPLEKETRNLIGKYLPELKKVFGNIIFTRNNSSLGFAGSFNRGIFMASGEKILVTNDDVFFPERTIAKLIATLSEKETYAFVGPINNDKNTLSYQYCRQVPTLSSYSSNEIGKLKLFSKWLAHEMAGRRMITDDIRGFCFAAYTKLIKDIGGFNTSYKYGYFEDNDIIQRALMMYGNESIVINMEVFVAHGGIHGSSGTVFQQPMKAVKSSIKNGLRYGSDWGYDKYLKIIWSSIHRQYSSKGTISEIFPKEIQF